MQFSFPVGSLFGVPIRIHASWFLVLALVTGMAGWQMAPGASLPVILVLGLAAAATLFTSVLLHELGHCVLARYFGIHVRQIQLFVFGGVAEILGEPGSALQEILIAAAGPFVSGILAALFAPLAAFAAGTPAGPVAFFGLMANLLIAAFNLIPAFPTDGGRILRALLWGATGNYRLATRIAAGLGMAFAACLIVGGMGYLGWTFLGSARSLPGDRLGGAWLAMVGLFLGRSAQVGVKQARISQALREGRIREAMLAFERFVPAGKTLLQVLTEAGGPSAADMLLGFPVGGEQGWLGFVEPVKVFAVPRDRWGVTKVEEVMTPLREIPRLEADAPLESLVRWFVQEGISGALVFEGERPVGYVSRADVARFIG